MFPISNYKAPKILNAVQVDQIRSEWYNKSNSIRNKWWMNYECFKNSLKYNWEEASKRGKRYNLQTIS